jgi:hypothetical protein
MTVIARGRKALMAADEKQSSQFWKISVILLHSYLVTIIISPKDSQVGRPGQTELNREHWRASPYA